MTLGSFGVTSRRRALSDRVWRSRVAARRAVARGDAEIPPLADRGMSRTVTARLVYVQRAHRRLPLTHNRGQLTGKRPVVWRRS
jgi:hypothetical protein